MKEQALNELSPSSLEEFDLGALIRTLQRHRLPFVLTGALVVILAMAYVILATPKYRAEVVVSTQGDTNQLAGLARRFGGAAAVAGVSLGESEVSGREEYLASLRSRHLKIEFINSLELKKHLFPARWNAKEEQWRMPKQTFLGGFLTWVSSFLAWTSGDLGWQKETEPEPSDGLVLKRFSRNLAIFEELDTGLVRIAYTDPDPVFAAKIANSFIDFANSVIQEDAIDHAQQTLAYLSGKLQEPLSADVRATIVALMQEHLETEALANSRKDFAFKVIDPALAPDQKIKPQRGIILFTSFIFGTLLGCVVVGILEVRRNV